MNGQTSKKVSKQANIVVLKRRTGVILVWVMFGVFLILAAWVSQALFIPLKINAEKIDVSIVPRSSVRQVGEQLIQAKLPLSMALFIATARVTGQDRKLQAGGYTFEKGITVWQILKRLAGGDQNESDILFVEGWTFLQMRASLNKNPDILHDTLSLSDAEIMHRIGADQTYPEGWFLPDTYLFAKGSSDLIILKRAYQAQQKNLDLLWQTRSPNLPLAKPYDALILASIIEKETGNEGDRLKVSGVFINRLRKGMPLQTDPTVIYGLGQQFDGNLRRQHLNSDNPYNSYLRTGLPPTPIAMPGRAALRSALHPEVHHYLYFVAKGEGLSEFSSTLNEHNRAVKRYILKRN